MTRTEDDLRTLLRAPLDPAAPERVLARVTHTTPTAAPLRADTPRRTWRIGLATGLALAVVGGTVTAVLMSRPNDQATPAPAATVPVTSAPVTSPAPTVASPGPGVLPPDGSVISFLAGSGYSMGLTTLRPGSQDVDAYRTGSTDAVATVHAGPVTLTPEAKPVITLGPTARATWATVTSPGAADAGPEVLTWTVDGLTITVRPRPGTTDLVVAEVARAVLVGSPEALPVPFSISAWPAAGWSVAGQVTRFGPDTAAGPATLETRIDLAVPGATGTAVTVDASEPSSGAGTGTPVVIAGRTWLWDAATTSFAWNGPDQVVRVASSNAGVGRAALQTLVAALTPATSFTDVSTWSDPGTAFPS